ncbi:NAD(P)/FAD-dependent oxidoreductase [Afifella aestuarii]|uniref:NAD(P)/FAD-dependent oxidoreductase n=1 Tax=Afifella aestuarii TaxID=1909496 RepID=UPI001FE56647|nr:FAD-dependent oxidoreductase [Afifella aestuarii]
MRDGSMHSEKKTAIVVGAGVVGVAAAIWLQRRGLDVLLIDREGPAAGASFGNAGLLASSAVVPVTEPGLPLKMPGMILSPDKPVFLRWPHLPKAMPFFLRTLRMCTQQKTEEIAAALAGIISDSLEQHQALAEGTGAEDFVVPCEYLYAYKSRSDFEASAFGFELRRKHGFTWRELDNAELHGRETLLAPDITFGVTFPNHGYIRDPGRYVEALAAHFVASGGRIVTADVTDIVRENDRVTGVRAGGDMFACDACVLAAGIWSGPLARSLGMRVPMESERGYHIEIEAPDETLKGPVMITAGQFVATPMTGRIRLAGVVEFGGLEAPPNEKIFDFIRRVGKAALPHLPWRESGQWMGHRPAPVDSIPLIGEFPAARGVYAAFGHHHLGLTGSAKTGRLVADLIAGHAPNIDLTPYRPDRP